MYDLEYNNSIALLYDSEFKSFSEDKWRNLKVGSIIKVNKNDILPADIIVLRSSNENGFCYLSTANLDGESVLKPREAITCFNKLIKNELSYANLNCLVEVDHPNEDIYKAEGTVILRETDEKFNFDINNILLRGGKLRNVEYIVGMVIYTGKETKLMQNIHSTNVKVSYIDEQMNFILIPIIIINILLCAVCTGFGAVFQNENAPTELSIGAYYIYPTVIQVDSVTLEIVKTYCSYFVNYALLVPLALLITVLLLKPMQALMISTDDELKLDPEDQLKVLNTKLHENLGTVKYIFSDKTGTLTKNEMFFHSCSVYGKGFGLSFLKNEGGNRKLGSNSNLHMNNLENNNINDVIEEDIYLENGSMEYMKCNKSSFVFSLVKKSILDALFDDDAYTELEDLHVPDNPILKISDSMREFFLGMILNHSVLPEKDENTDEILFQGPSPDEVLVVSSANEIGFQFVERTSEVINVDIFNEEFQYKILNKFEFSSARKRSSIIVRAPDGKIIVYIKGADDIILPTLNDFSVEHLLKSSKKHINQFAETGLRTLIYTKRELTEGEYQRWLKEYEEMKYQSISNKKLNVEVEKIISKIESNSLLLGVTGLEDKLQNDVNNVISNFIDAGISFWMLTGDKLDTAENIGFSCKLFNDDTEIFRIRETNKNGNIKSKEELFDELTETLRNMDYMEKELMNFKIENKVSTKSKIKEIFQTEQEKKEADLKLEVQLEKIKSTPVFNEILNNNQEHNLSDNQDNHNLERDTDSQNQKLKLEILKLNYKYNKVKTATYDNNNINKSHHETSSQQEKERDKEEIFSPLKSQRSAPNEIDLEQKKSEEACKIILSREVSRNKNIEKIGSSKHNEQQQKENNGNNCNNGRTTSHSRPVSSKFQKKLNFLQLQNPSEMAKLRLDSINKNDLHILKFIMKKKREEENISKEEDDDVNHIEAEDVSILDDILNEIQNLENNHNGREGEPDKKNGETVFEINQIYDHYNKKLREIEDNKNPKFIKQLKIMEAIEEKKRKQLEVETKGGILVNFSMILEGAAISMCLDPEMSEYTWKIIKKCRSLICCRCNPMQKADIVKFVKEKSNEVVLSIGDGGNDVNMLKEANVGVGIFGKEGYQAAYNSDYAISQFKYLKRLLFNHGRYYILRNSYFILFFLFKNIIFCLPQFLFIFFNGYSGTSIYDSWYYLGYEFFFTNVPHGMRMLYEEDIDIELNDYPNKLKKLIPDIYKETMDSQPFSIKKYLIILFVGLYQSCIIFFFPLISFSFGISDDEGRVHGFYDASICVFMSVIIIQFIILIDDTFYWVKNTWISWIFQVLFNCIFIWTYDIQTWATMNYVTQSCMRNMRFWLTLGVTIVLCVFPVSIYQRINTLYSDGIINNLRVQKYEFGLKIKKISRKIEKMGELTRSFAKFKKIMNNNKFIPDNNADKKIKNYVDQFYKQHNDNHDKFTPITVRRLNSMNQKDYSSNKLLNEIKFKHDKFDNKTKEDIIYNSEQKINRNIDFNTNQIDIIGVNEDKNDKYNNNINYNSNNKLNLNINYNNNNSDDSNNIHDIDQDQDHNKYQIGGLPNSKFDLEAPSPNKHSNSNYTNILGQEHEVIKEEEIEESQKIDMSNSKMDLFFKQVNFSNDTKEIASKDKDIKKSSFKPNDSSRREDSSNIDGNRPKDDESTLHIEGHKQTTKNNRNKDEEDNTIVESHFINEEDIEDN